MSIQNRDHSVKVVNSVYTKFKKVKAVATSGGPMQGVHSSRANGRYNLHNIEVVILVKSTEQLSV